MKLLVLFACALIAVPVYSQQNSLLEGGRNMFESAANLDLEALPGSNATTWSCSYITAAGASGVFEAHVERGPSMQFISIIPNYSGLMPGFIKRSGIFSVGESNDPLSYTVLRITETGELISEVAWSPWMFDAKQMGIWAMGSDFKMPRIPAVSSSSFLVYAYQACSPKPK